MEATGKGGRGRAAGKLGARKGLEGRSQTPQRLSTSQFPLTVSARLVKCPLAIDRGLTLQRKNVWDSLQQQNAAGLKNQSKRAWILPFKKVPNPFATAPHSPPQPLRLQQGTNPLPTHGSSPDDVQLTSMDADPPTDGGSTGPHGLTASSNRLLTPCATRFSRLKRSSTLLVLVTLLCTFGVGVGQVEGPGLIGPTGGIYRIGQAKHPGPPIVSGRRTSWLDDPDGPAMEVEDGGDSTLPNSTVAASCGSDSSGPVSGSQLGYNAVLQEFIETKRQEAIARRRDRLAEMETAAQGRPPPTAGTETRGTHDFPEWFRKSGKYLGHFGGWHFTSGVHGVGYYLEASKPRQLQLATATAQPSAHPLPISIYEALAIPGQNPPTVATHSNDHTGRREKRTPTATRRQSAVALSNLRKAEGKEEPWGSGQCPLYGTDQSLAA